MSCRSCASSTILQAAVILGISAAVAFGHRTFWGMPISFGLDAPSGPVKPGDSPRDKPSTPTPAKPTDGNSPKTAPPQPTTPTKPAYFISTDEVKAKMEAGGVMLVDARNPEQFAQGHIAGAINLSVGHFTGDRLMGTEQKINFLLPRSSEVIVYCDGGSCDASILVAQQLRVRGFNTLKVYEDGIAGWTKSGGAISTDPEPQVPDLNASPSMPGGGQ